MIAMTTRSSISVKPSVSQVVTVSCRRPASGGGRPSVRLEFSSGERAGLAIWRISSLCYALAGPVRVKRLGQ